MRRTALAAALLAVSASAHAADFTFKVPVNLTDFVAPAAVKGSKVMQCTVSGVAGGTAVAALDVRAAGAPAVVVIGNGYAGVSIPPSGNLNTTVSVDVNVPAPNRPQNATSYQCSLSFSVDILSGGTWMNPVHTVGSYFERFDDLIKNGQLKPKAGTTPVFIVSGNIPK